MKLNECELGRELIIESVHLDDDHCFRLREIGLTEGANIKVCQDCAFGGKMLSKGTERIGIDKKIAESIEVSYA
jgi:ferrous iron transport protein A